MPNNPPYMSSPGNIAKVLNKIAEAATPDRFTQDFLQTKLAMSGGGARPLIPFLKRIGFLSNDGRPTSLYKRYRNPDQSGAAIAEALRHGYRDIYQINEYAHELSDAKLKGVVTQATGLAPDSRVVQLIVSSFNQLKSFADFDAAPAVEEPSEQYRSSFPPIQGGSDVSPPSGSKQPVGMNLAYTINLNLPATSDITVFNAIFSSLREHLLKGEE